MADKGLLRENQRVVLFWGITVGTFLFGLGYIFTKSVPMKSLSLAFLNVMSDRIK